MGIPYTTNVDLLTGVDGSRTGGTTVTSVGVGADVSKRQLRSIQFIGTGVSSGNAVFTVDISNNGGTNWERYQRLQQNTTTANAVVASVTISSSTSTTVFFPSGDYMQMIRANATISTDGRYYAILQAGG